MKEIQQKFFSVSGKIGNVFRVYGKDKSLEKFGINLEKNLMRINL